MLVGYPIFGVEGTFFSFFASRIPLHVVNIAGEI